MTWRAMTRSPDCATLQSAHVSNVRLAESNSTPTTTVRGWPSPSPSPPSSNPIFQQSLSSLSVFCWFWFLVLGLVLFLLLFNFWVFGVVREREKETEKTKSIYVLGIARNGNLSRTMGNGGKLSGLWTMLCGGRGGQLSLVNRFLLTYRVCDPLFYWLIWIVGLIDFFYSLRYNWRMLKNSFGSCQKTMRFGLSPRQRQQGTFKSGYTIQWGCLPVPALL